MAVIKDKAWLESLCRSYTEANVRTLAGWANGKDVTDDLKFRAITELMNRGWGRPSQDIKAEHVGAIEVIIRDIAAEKASQKP